MGRRSRRRREVITVRSAMPSPSLTSLLRTFPTLDGPRHLSRDVEDRRRYHPLADYAPPLTFRGVPAKVQVKQKFSRPHKMAGFSTPSVPKRVAFTAPKKVLVCVRREQRKEVLFALRRTKKGSGSKKFRTPFSEVSCKR